MDSFFLPLVAAALAEWGDKTQILAMMLGVRFGKPVPVFIGVGIAAAINMGLAAFGGSLIASMISPDAALLFLTLGFAFAAVGAFVPFSDTDADAIWGIGAITTSAIGFLLIELGDKTQFITAGFGAVSPNWILTAIGATLGVMIGCAPAIILGQTLRERAPLTSVRRSIGVLFAFVSSVLAINAFSLI
ncbi:TMEM165/GDT1 family protein [Parasphingopyxis lamellibrachiae]|uniref:GDT1 family protein n=1 Tax=Parasphingopyxis lamellibrachiae TaxID=680125 RepID=A0A3D9FK01_9SPHN|nr:TMEM165/GDT1 family protein [Parasphingopyxis lamellibrachiae]RED17411.1 putative Ca2+/H+ antiporter (TMEM165/GDT1 family) [Parasphingopyxis lamellibrachiae]